MLVTLANNPYSLLEQCSAMHSCLRLRIRAYGLWPADLINQLTCSCSISDFIIWFWRCWYKEVNWCFCWSLDIKNSLQRAELRESSWKWFCNHVIFCLFETFDNLKWNEIWNPNKLSSFNPFPLVFYLNSFMRYIKLVSWKIHDWVTKQFHGN